MEGRVEWRRLWMGVMNKTAEVADQIYFEVEIFA